MSDSGFGKPPEELAKALWMVQQAGVNLREAPCVVVRAASLL